MSVPAGNPVLLEPILKRAQTDPQFFGGGPPIPLVSGQRFENGGPFDLSKQSGPREFGYPLFVFHRQVVDFD